MIRQSRTKRILLLAEAATLAHVARPLVLAGSLDRTRFDVSFAADPHYKWVLRDFDGKYHPIASIGTKHFLAALARGAPVYDENILTRYVEDDLELLAKIAPDVVVGDFRLSLSVSARLAGVPYIAISNCYWSPYWRPKRYAVPSLPLTHYLPVPLAGGLFRLARPIAFAVHSRPLNRVRRHYGLPSLGHDLRRTYTDADHVLYADVPALYPDAKLPAQHHFIGPLLWSPPVPEPQWWNALPADRPVVYVTMGSSGQINLLGEILRALDALNVTAIAATAGSTAAHSIPQNAYVTDYLPGLEAAQRASLVICNGGAPTCHQALSAGVPIVGLPTNLDQFLNMETLVQAGVGTVLRADRFSAAKLRETVQVMLAQRRYTDAAGRIAKALREQNARLNFQAVLEQLLPN